MTGTAQLTRRAAIALTAAAVAGPSLAQDALEAKGYALGDIPMGAEDAKVTIVEYASLTCPHCATFHNQTFGELKERYIDTGKVRFIMREVYFDKFGVWGSMLARCGGEANYHQITDLLLKRQREWYSNHVRGYQETNDPRPIVDELFKIGRLVGMSNQRMTECLEDGALLERIVADYQKNAEADGVRSTPTFIINGEKITGAQPISAMAAEIEKHL